MIQDVNNLVIGCKKICNYNKITVTQQLQQKMKFKYQYVKHSKCHEAHGFIQVAILKLKHCCQLFFHKNIIIQDIKTKNT